MQEFVDGAADFVRSSGRIATFTTSYTLRELEDHFCHHQTMSEYAFAPFQEIHPGEFITWSTSDDDRFTLRVRALEHSTYDEAIAPYWALLAKSEVDIATSYVSTPFTTVQHLWADTLKRACAGLSPTSQRALRKANPRLDAPLVSGGAKPSTVIIREHPLLEKLNFVARLIEDGYQAHNIFFLPKDDRTKNRDLVLATLRSIGVRTLRLIEDVSPIVVTAEELIVVDDGGTLILHCSQLSGRPERAFFIETTTRGIARINALESRPVTLNLANCSTKLAASRSIAASCLFQIRHHLRHEAMAGQKCILVGFGNIGSSLASLLRDLGSIVHVVELDHDKRDEARHEGFLCYERLVDAVDQTGSKLIVGCSGAPSVSVDDFPASGTFILSSVSSGDLSKLLASASQAGFSKHVYEEGLILSRGQLRLRILGEGHSINLFRAEGVPEPEFDSFLAVIHAAVLHCSLAGTHPDDAARIDIEAFCRQIANA